MNGSSAVRVFYVDMPDGAGHVLCDITLAHRTESLAPFYPVGHFKGSRVRPINTVSVFKEGEFLLSLDSCGPAYRVSPSYLQYSVDSSQEPQRFAGPLEIGRFVLEKGGHIAGLVDGIAFELASALAALFAFLFGTLLIQIRPRSKPMGDTTKAKQAGTAASSPAIPAAVAPATLDSMPTAPIASDPVPVGPITPDLMPNGAATPNLTPVEDTTEHARGAGPSASPSPRATAGVPVTTSPPSTPEPRRTAERVETSASASQQTGREEIPVAERIVLTPEPDGQIDGSETANGERLVRRSSRRIQYSNLIIPEQDNDNGWREFFDCIYATENPSTVREPEPENHLSWLDDYWVSDAPSVTSTSSEDPGSRSDGSIGAYTARMEEEIEMNGE